MNVDTSLVESSDYSHICSESPLIYYAVINHDNSYEYFKDFFPLAYS